MKPFWGSLLVWAVSGANAFADSPDDVSFLSAGWLKKGCVSVVVMGASPKSFTKEQERSAISVTTWLNGFITGANSMCVSGSGSENASPITYPPQDWLDPRKLAPKILAFLDCHPQIPRSAKSREVMMAFYYSSHPKGTELHRAIASNLIEDMSREKASDQR